MGKKKTLGERREPERLDIHDTQFGQTPLDPDAAAFLTSECADIETLDELNEAEALNTLDAVEWLESQELSPEDILSQSFFLELHQRMFCDVWTWAGRIRERETNMGIDPIQIREQLQMLLGDVSYWIENETYEAAEIGARLHHRSVQIHPFTNGNGRHARLCANKLGQALGLGEEPYTWGRGSADREAARLAYLDALREADQGNYSALVEVALS